jgi:hypothetical protein
MSLCQYSYELVQLFESVIHLMHVSTENCSSFKNFSNKNHISNSTNNKPIDTAAANTAVIIHTNV